MTTIQNASAEAGVAVPAQPPRENLVRGIRPGAELRAAEDGGMPTLVGRFAVFNEWTEIDSVWEGQFLERVAPGAFSKTITENRGGMRVLFDHGHDPHIGSKPLGPIEDLREEEDGPHYVVPLFDTAYNRELIPGLEAGVYGASFRFKVMREEFEKKPEPSTYNPSGLPERTITEARVMEFGPVTFPAYEGATAGVRSLTDDFILAELVGSPDRLRDLLTKTTIAPSTPTPAVATSAPERRESQPKRFNSRKDYLEWLSKS
jgi:HK97 family phage prohead protease